DAHARRVIVLAAAGATGEPETDLQAVPVLAATGPYRAGALGPRLVRAAEPFDPEWDGQRKLQDIRLVRVIITGAEVNPVLGEAVVAHALQVPAASGRAGDVGVCGGDELEVPLAIDQRLAVHPD